MSFDSLPVNQRSYKRFAPIAPSETTVIDPPPDAILTYNAGFIDITGTNDVETTITVVAAPQIWPFSIKKLMQVSTTSVVGLWYD